MDIVGSHAGFLWYVFSYYGFFEKHRSRRYYDVVTFRKKIRIKNLVAINKNIKEIDVPMKKDYREIIGIRVCHIF